MTETKNLINRNGNYSLMRRVPRQYQSIESRKTVWISLHTDSLSEAGEKAQDVWANQIAGWEAQLAGRSSDATKHFDAVQKVALAKGIKYLPMPEVARLPSDQLYDRLELIGTRNGNLNSMEAAALLGAVDVPSITVSAALEEYWGLTKDKILRKSKDQVRRWRNPKIKSVRNFIEVVGDKPIAEITRDDMLTFRNWWLERIENEGLDATTANKDLQHFGSVLTQVNDMKKLGLDLPVHKLNLSEGKKKPRPQFSEEWIKTKLLADGALDGLNLQARTIFLAMINTGARPSELANLMPEHIALDHQYPHISITTDGREEEWELKSDNSERLIPLLGVSFEAMRECPDGFPKYRDNPGLSATINRYLSTQSLRETPRHSIYSLRHSFEERLRKAGVGERLRAELFGHSYRGERYGAPKLDELTDAIRPIAF